MSRRSIVESDEEGNESNTLTELWELTTNLTKHSTKTKRKEACNLLIDKLYSCSNSKLPMVMKQLSKNYQDLENKYCVLWQHMLRNAITVAKTAYPSGKQKSKAPPDSVLITLPGKILKNSESQSQKYVSCDKKLNVYTFLGYRDVTSFLEFSLEAICGENNITDESMDELCGQFMTFCAQRPLVNLLRKQQIEYILNEVERIVYKRLRTDENVSFNKTKYMVQAFSNLMRNCAGLGRDLHHIIPGVCTMIKRWCKSRLKNFHDDVNKNADDSFAAPMFQVLVHLFSSNFEACISAIVDNRDEWLKYIKVTGWRRARQRDEKELRIAIIDFLRSLLHIAELSGKMHGLPTGDIDTHIVDISTLDYIQNVVCSTTRFDSTSSSQRLSELTVLTLKHRQGLYLGHLLGLVDGDNDNSDNELPLHEILADGFKPSQKGIIYNYNESPWGIFTQLPKRNAQASCPTSVDILNVISTAAQMFPRGECWSSELVHFSNDNLKCTSRDLASVVLLTLKHSNGANKLAGWRPLLKLCVPSAKAYNDSDLQSAWKSVWDGIMEDDERIARNEWVMVLTEIIRCALIVPLLDLTFLWNKFDFFTDQNMLKEKSLSIYVVMDFITIITLAYGGKIEDGFVTADKTSKGSMLLTRRHFFVLQCIKIIEKLRSDPEKDIRCKDLASTLRCIASLIGVKDCNSCLLMHSAIVASSGVNFVLPAPRSLHEHMLFDIYRYDVVDFGSDLETDLYPTSDDSSLIRRSHLHSLLCFRLADMNQSLERYFLNVLTDKYDILNESVFDITCILLTIQPDFAGIAFDDTAHKLITGQKIARYDLFCLFGIIAHLTNSRHYPTNNFKNLCVGCKKWLKEFALRGSVTHNTRRDSILSPSNGYDVEFFGSNDVSDRSAHKRKRAAYPGSSTQARRKKRKNCQTIATAALSAESARLLITIVCNVSPTLETFVHLFELVIWPLDCDDLEEGGRQIHTPPDLSLGVFLLHLLAEECSYGKIIDRNEQTSVIETVCDAITGLRDSLCDISLYFELACKFARYCTINNAEQKLFVQNILYCEDSKDFRRRLQASSRFRVEQVWAVSYLINNLEDSSRISEVIPALLEKILEPALVDIDYRVRVAAVKACAVAFQYLPYAQTKLCNKIETFLPPLKLTPLLEIPANEVKDKFLKWADTKLSKGMLPEEPTDLLLQRVSYESTAVLFLGAIAGFAQSKVLAQSAITKIIILAASAPLLELRCFSTLKQVSINRGYENITSMFKSDMPDILRTWCSKCLPIIYLPLTLISPLSVDRLLIMKRSENLFENIDEEKNNEMERKLMDIPLFIESDALPAFCVDHAPTLVPLLLRNIADNLGTDVNTESIFVHARRCKHWDSFEELAEILTRGKSEKHLSKLVRKQLPSLYGTMVEIFFNRDENEESHILGENLRKLIYGFNGVRQVNQMKDASNIMLFLLHRSYGGYFNWSRKAVLYIIENFVKKKVQSNCSIFDQAGMSVNECIIRTRFQIDHSPLPSRCHAWSTLFFLIHEEISNYTCDSGQLDFCVSSILNCLSLNSNHLKLIQTLKPVLLNYARSSSPSDMLLPETIIDTVIGLIQVHNNVLSELVKRSKRNRRNTSDAHVKESILVLKESFFMLEKLLKNREILALNIRLALIPFCSPENIYGRGQDDLKYLGPEIQNYLLTAVMDDFRNGIPKQSVFEEITSLLNALDRHYSEPSLELLCKCLKGHQYEIHEALDQSQHHELLLRLLHKLQCLKSPAAAKCLGNLGHIDWTLLQSSRRENDFQIRDPLSKIKSRSLVILGQCLCSNDTKMALRAMETVKAILSDQENNVYLLAIRDGRLRSILSSFTSEDYVKAPELDEDEVADICGIDVERVRKNGNWCWEIESFWQCNNDYDAWVKRLVCAIQACCYYQFSTNDDEDVGQGLVGTQHFFYQCSSMCTLNSDLCGNLFPGIIYDLLKYTQNSDDEIDDGDEAGVKSGEKCRRRIYQEAMTEVSIDAMSGFNNGQAIDRISNRFSKFLSSGRRGGNNPYAISLALDTIDFLRNITRLQFECSDKHKRNSANGKNPAPAWKGLPHGCVLKLDGLAVASSCVYTRRFCLALYYCELFADHILGGSGDCLRRLVQYLSPAKVNKDNSILARDDISGFLAASHDQNHNFGEYTIEFMSILRECFEHLAETDAIKGVSIYNAELNFRRQYDGQPHITAMATKPGDALATLDTQLQAKGANFKDTSTNVAVIHQLQSLGFFHIANTYTSGLGTQQDSSEIRESFHRSSWRAFQWDDSILHRSAFGGQPLASTKLSPKIYSMMPTFEQSYSTAYQYSFDEGLDLLLRYLFSKDNQNFYSTLAKIRLDLMSNARIVDHGDILLSHTSILTSQFSIYNEVESAAEAIFSIEYSKKEVHSLCQTWEEKCKRILPLHWNCDFRLKESLFACKEILLKYFCNDSDDDHNLCSLSVVRSHLRSYLELCRLHSSPENARRVMLRLRRTFTDILDLDEVGYLALEEARILECSGNVDGAIRTAKLSVKTFEGQDNFEMSAKCLLTCGKMMAFSKVESTRSILDGFLRPAVIHASNAYENSDGVENRHKLADAYLVLGNFVGGLQDTIATRVKSQKWKEDGEALNSKKNELIQAESMLLELKEKMNKEAGKKQRRSSRSNEADELELKTKLTALGRYIRELEKVIKSDSSEREAVLFSLKNYQYETIQSLSNALVYESNDKQATNAAVIKLVSLWLGVIRSQSSDDDLDNHMKQCIEDIPSHYFIPLIYQLFSRLEDTTIQNSPSSRSQSNKITFQEVLRFLIIKLCTEHPYHTIVQLVTLSNGEKVGSTSDSRDYLDNVGTSKVKAANDIIDDLKKGSSNFVSELVSSYEEIISSYIILAMFSTKKLLQNPTRRTKGFKMSAAYDRKSKYAPLTDIIEMLKQKGRPIPCVLTSPPNVRVLKDYGNGEENPIGGELISSFSATFDVTETGIHRPKIIICEGSRGGQFKQLVKGYDDIRQDAVMQQVFKTVNKLLRYQRHSTTARQQEGSTRVDRTGALFQHLQIATYNIVPLSPACGVIEWVENTLPFGRFLEDKGTPGAHSRYYPGEWNIHACRHMLAEASKSKKRRVYDKIMRNISPAFRFFFTEKFSHDISAWHAAKMRYTRSCAVNSIVGHILGIGDRHAQNILIHEVTGEVVHIDFGIVFEQGKTLNTPETVPFRLTPDIVDGFGPTGTDGAFTCAAELTLGMLREKRNTSHLMTILSAIVADPLYKWSISPISARRRQRTLDEMEIEKDCVDSFHSTRGVEIEEGENEGGNRALSKVFKKLSGIEDDVAMGEMKNVEGQVRLLINEARDHDNLCAIFPGWSPML